MKYINKIIPKLNFKEFLLGVSLGTGYMTSLRFVGPVGVSEILMLIFIFLLVLINGKSTVVFPRNEYGRIKLLMFISVGVVLPITTAVFYFNDKIGSDPVYIISFMAGCLLAFMLAENADLKISINNATLWFAVSFIISNVFFSLMYPEELTKIRYTGAAKNPNQLVFYATSLTLLLIIYNKFAAAFYTPFVLYFMLKVGSDAYVLALVVTSICLFAFYFYFKVGAKSKLKLVFAMTAAVCLLGFVILIYSDELISIWLSADEGNARTTLMYNGLVASLKSPLFGYGAGSFSTYDGFSAAEAHNTFLDLSMQFGFLYPILIYYLFFRYFIFKFERKLALDCAFFVAFVISGLFHFSGRHFVFWVELGVFMSFIYFPKSKKI